MIEATLFAVQSGNRPDVPCALIRIANDQSGSEETSNHDVAILTVKFGHKQPTAVRQGRLEGFDRGNLTYYHMVARALAALAGDGYGQPGFGTGKYKLVIEQIEPGSRQRAMEGLAEIATERNLDGVSDHTVKLYRQDAGRPVPAVSKKARLSGFRRQGAGALDLLTAALGAATTEPN